MNGGSWSIFSGTRPLLRYHHQTMAPILAEGFTSPDLPLLAPPCSRKLSSSSAQSLVDLLGTSSTSRLTPTVVVSEDGLRHAKIRLDAR